MGLTNKEKRRFKPISDTKPITDYLIHDTNAVIKLTPKTESTPTPITILTLEAEKEIYLDLLNEPKIAVFVHSFFPDVLISDILPKLLPLKNYADFYFNFTENTIDADTLSIIKEIFNPTVTITKNKGRDIGGFFHCFEQAYKTNKKYDYYLVLHTKKTIHYPDLGIIWRNQLLNATIKNKEHIENVIFTFENNNKIGMIGAKEKLIENNATDEELRKLKFICDYFNIKTLRNKAILGTMFWVRAPILDHYFRNNNAIKYFRSSFIENDGDICHGELPHAFERFFGTMVYNLNYTIEGDVVEKKYSSKKTNIWQLYYSDSQLNLLDPKFIPRKCKEPDIDKNPIMENLDIIDIYYNKSKTWTKSDYIGIVSARFEEKTKLTYHQIISEISDDYQIYSLSPISHHDQPPVYSKIYFYKDITKMCEFVDSRNILPIKLYGYNKQQAHCNYWLVNPQYFKDYVENWLMPVYNLFYKSDEGNEFFKCKRLHGKKQICSVAFFLEGLFAAFLHDKKFKHIYIK